MKYLTSLSNVSNSSYSFHPPQQYLQLSHILCAVVRTGQLISFKWGLASGLLSGQMAEAEPHLLGSQAEHQLSHLFSAADFHATFRAVLSVTPLLHYHL